MKPITNRRIAPTIAGLGLTAALLTTPMVRTTAHAATAPATTPSVVITIPGPREASLLQLHGYGGSGMAQIRIDGQCFSRPVLIAAPAASRCKVGRTMPRRIGKLELAGQTGAIAS